MVDSLPKEARVNIHTKSSGDDRNTKSIIRTACGPLLEILEDETISIIHHSFTEYLLDPGRGESAPSTDTNKLWFPVIDSAASHRSMAITCVNYLIYGWDHDWQYECPKNYSYLTPAHPPLGVGAVYARYPFLKYASSYWSHHASQFGQPDQDLFKLLDQFMAPASKAFLSWHELRKADIHFTNCTNGSAMQVAAGEGLAFYVEYLIQLGQPINDEDTDGKRALHRAAAKGHSQVIDTLLKRGADPDPDDNFGLKPLHLAALGNHAKVVKILLGAGVDPRTPKTKETRGRTCGNAPTTYGDTADKYAFTYGHTEAAMEFVPYLKPEDLNEALMWAAENGNSEVVLATLDTGRVEINKMMNGKTLLYLAAYKHDLHLFQKLLSLGADVEIKCNSVFERHGLRCIGPDDELKSTPLHALSRNGHHLPEAEGKANQEKTLGILKLLLESGSDVNAVDAAGKTPLHLAVSGNRYTRGDDVDMVAELLGNGADPSATTVDGYQALHLAKCNGSIVRHLIANGANVDIRHPKTGKTPLFYAIEKDCYDDRFAVLIESGADCSVQDEAGDTPLHVALRALTSPITKIEELLKRMADPKVKNKKGETPLHGMEPSTELEEVLSMLVKYGADLEAKTPSGQTVLMRVFSGWQFRSSPGVLLTFLNAGAFIDSRDYDGKTIRHLLCENGHSVPLVWELVKAGADPLAVDFAGNTILHYAARQTVGELLETLIDSGVGPSLKNNLGQVAFHIAAGTREQQYTNQIPDPFDFLLGPKCKSDVNAGDNRGVRPIHLAATLSEKQVRRLLAEGADASFITVEGQSLLHIASRARQSNIVGLVTNLFVSRGMSRLIDHMDKDGRTALHYASRSGRVESVRILLDAGANPNATDQKGMSPLDACAEFPKDDYLWNLETANGTRTSFMDAAYVTLDDPHRPREPKEVPYHIIDRRSCSRDISSEHDTVAIRPIVRLLLAHGCDITSRPLETRHEPCNHFPCPPTSSHLEIAVASGCEVLVDELLHEIGKTNQPPTNENTDENMIRHLLPRNAYLERYLSLKSHGSAEILDGLVQAGEPNLSLFECLLRTESEQAVLRFRDLGADLLAPDLHGDNPLTTLTKWGYADLLAQIGLDASVMDGRLKSVAESEQRGGTRTKRPLLHTACERALPNLEVIRLLVEKFNVDVNAIDTTYTLMYGPASTALHILAESSHWWQAQALEYLLDRGAEVDAKDNRGFTPLRIAVENRGVKSVQVLLRHGADCNVLGGDGLSCLNKAGADSEILHLLIENGADVTTGSRPFIFDAIAAMNLDILSLVIQMGADCNIPMTLSEREEEFRYPDQFPRNIQLGTLSEKEYPVHFAASARYNTTTSRPRMMPIIECLLQGGADSFRLHKKQDPLLHDLCRHDGIIEPFLDIPNINLEARDSHGRTLLLAACSRSQGQSQGFHFSDISVENLETLPSSAALLLSKGAKVDAVDATKMNAFHCILASISNAKILKRDFDLLISHASVSALITQADDSGRTALLYAVENQHLWAIETLLEKGADPGHADDEGTTALHLISKYLASNNEAESYFKKFVSLGVSIDSLNSSGQTPLFVYIARSTLYLKHLSLFTNAAANLFATNQKGQNLLHLIAGKGVRRDQYWGRWQGEEKDQEVEMFCHLMEKGLDVTKEDDEQRTPLDLAVAAGNERIMALFARKR